MKAQVPNDPLSMDILEFLLVPSISLQSPTSLIELLHSSIVPKDPTGFWVLSAVLTNLPLHRVLGQWEKVG